MLSNVPGVIHLVADWEFEPKQNDSRARASRYLAICLLVGYAVAHFT